MDKDPVTPSSSRRLLTQRVGFSALSLIALLTVAPILLLVGYIVMQGAPAISLEFVTGFPREGMRAGGILPAIVGTFYLTLGTALFSVPLGVGAAIYLSEYAAETRWTRIIRLAIINLAGIPSVVYGLFGLGLFWHVSQSQYPPALAAKGLLVQIGVWPVSEPVMVAVPAGSFEMGGLVGDGDRDERPVHTVRFAELFEIGVHEVTFGQYDLFAAASGRAKPNDEGWGRRRRPVINVSWDDAVAYAEWLSQKTAKNYRLPTEAEWEYAARAGTKTSRYWQEAPDQNPDPACTQANVFDRGNAVRIKSTFTVTWDPFECGDPFPFTAPVGEFDPNAWGLRDMLGNVWEWVRDCWHQSYEGAPDDGSAWAPDDPADCGARVIRGGSWLNLPGTLRSADRVWGTPVYRLYNLGFRLARSS